MDLSALLKRLQLLFAPSLRGKQPEGASNCQDIDLHVGSCHSADGTKEKGNDFILILHYCKQEILKHLNDTLLDFILLFSEHDESFSPTNCLYALGTLAFKQGSKECLENVLTIVIENCDSPDASFVMNDLGVMLSLKAMYERSEECFSKAKKWFHQEEDHLKNAIVTLNLAALYMILGDYKKACDFCNDAADLCHDITMRSTKDIDLPMKVLRRAADLLSECGNFEKFCLILRIGGKYNFGARKASKIDVRKWLMGIQLKEQTGEKIEVQELWDCSSYLLLLLEKVDAQSLNADLITTVFIAGRVIHRNGLHEEALKLLEKLESAFLLMGGRKDLLYGLMLFQVGQFKYMYGCGMIRDAENDLKQADAILMKYFGRNHLVAHCKKLLGSCAMLNNNLGDAATNLTEALTFFGDLNSQHFELASISLKLAQLRIEERIFGHAKEILHVNAVQKAVEILTYSFGEISPKTGIAHVQAGLILQKVDKGAAIDEVNKAVEIYRNLGLQVGHPVFQLCQGMTGLFQLCLGNKQEGEKCFVDVLKDSPLSDESWSWLRHEVEKLFTEFNTGYFKERPLYQSAKILSLAGLVSMKKGKDDRQKYLDSLASLAEKSDTEEQGVIDFAGHFYFVSPISCLAGPIVYFLIFLDPEKNSQSSNDDEVVISRSKNSSCILFWRTSCKIHEMKELRNLNFQIRESISTLFMQPIFRKSYEETDDFYLELPLRDFSLCAQIDCLPLLVEVKLGEPHEDCANFDYLTSWTLEDSSPQEPAVHVSYLSYEFLNKHTAELAFDFLVFSSSKEPLLKDIKAVEYADGDSACVHFAFFPSQRSRYSHFSVFVDKELPVLRVKCRHLNESKSNGFCFSVQSALQNVMLSLSEAVRICFEPFVQLPCEGRSMVCIKEYSNVNCSSAVKTESSIASPQAGVLFNNCANDSFTEKELDSGTKHLLNRVTCRRSLHCEGSNRESSTRNCGKESDLKPFSSKKSSLGCASAQDLKPDFDKECNVSTLENQEVHSGSHADVCLCLLEYLLSDRNVAPEHEALNSVIPHSDSFEEHSFLSSEFLLASSRNSPPGSPELSSPCDPFTLKKSSSACSTLIGCFCHHKKEEPLADGCLAKAQSKPTAKETHQHADVCEFKTELNEKKIKDNCHSIDGVLKQPESIVVSEMPFRESNECHDIQIGANPHSQCQSFLEEMEVSTANGIGVRAPRNRVFDPFMLSKDEESATFQNNCFELLQQINELKEQLRQREAENQQLKAEVGRYLFLEDREKRSGKLLSVPREIASDESISCGANASFKCGTTNGRLLGGAASLQDNPDFNLQARFIDISNSLSPEEFKQMKILARGKVNGFRLAKMKVGFELLKEVERVSKHPRADIGELLKEIQRIDLLEKLGVPSPESKPSVSAGTSSDSLPSRDERLQDLEQELDEERCATQMSCKSIIGFAHRSEDNGQKFTPDHDCDLYASVSFESDSEDPVSINIEDNDLLPKDEVRASVKEGIFVPNCPDRSGLLSGGSCISVSSSDSLALISAESTPVCSTSSSQGSFEKLAKAPELSLTTHSASARGEIVNESNLGLNTGNSEERERESNECPDMQIKVQHHPQCQNSLEEMEVSAANDIGVRTPTNSGLDPFMLSKEEESATFQNNCFELLKQINELKEQLRQREAENQQLKAEVGRYLFLEDREKRSGKLLSVPRVSASDDSKSCGASASSKGVTTNGRLLGGAESAGASTDCVPSRDERLQDLDPEQDEERCANHMSINMKDNDPLSMESVGTNAKESICVPNPPNKSGPSSDCSSISVSSSDSLVLSTAEGTSVSLSSSSQGSSEKSAKAPEVALTTHSAAARGEIASESNLDTGGSEEEVPALAQLLNSTNDLTDGGNIEVGDIEGQSVDLCYGASGTSRSDTRSPLSECDLQISSSDSYAFCPLADPENLHVGDGNLLHLQQSSNAHGQTTLGMHGSDVASSSSTGWECLGARPKSSQTQRPLVAISPPPPPLIVSPISDGLAGDFLVRHSQDKAVHESLFSNGGDFSFLDNDTSQGVSFVEGSTNASEAYRVRPCFGACQVAVGNNSYVRSDGNAFSHVPGGDFERARLLAGISYNESFYGISPPTAAAPLTIPTGPSNVTMGWNGSSRDGANNVDGFLNTDHRVTGQRDYSRESYFPYVQHNTHVGHVPIHWQSNASSRITSPGFAYGLTSSGFTFGPLGGGGFAGVRPRQSLHATQRHVVTDGDSVFIDEQSANEMSHDVDLALGRQSLANRNHELPTSAGSAVIVDNCGLPLPLSVSAYSINSTRGISATTSHPLVVSASNGTRGLDNNASRNSVVSSATPVDENAETSLAPVSVNFNENNSRGALLNRDNGTNYIEPIDDSLLALERRVADASALDERMLREREEREQFAQVIERRERMIRERRERERREREEREIQEVEEQEQEIPDGVRWLQELEDTSFGTPMAL